MTRPDRRAVRAAYVQFLAESLGALVVALFGVALLAGWFR